MTVRVDIRPRPQAANHIQIVGIDADRRVIAGRQHLRPRSQRHIGRRDFDRTAGRQHAAQFGHRPVHQLRAAEREFRRFDPQQVTASDAHRPCRHGQRLRRLRQQRAAHIDITGETQRRAGIERDVVPARQRRRSGCMHAAHEVDRPASHCQHRAAFQPARGLRQRDVPAERCDAGG